MDDFQELIIREDESPALALRTSISSGGTSSRPEQRMLQAMKTSDWSDLPEARRWFLHIVHRVRCRRGVGPLLIEVVHRETPGKSPREIAPQLARISLVVSPQTSRPYRRLVSPSPAHGGGGQGEGVGAPSLSLAGTTGRHLPSARSQRPPPGTQRLDFDGSNPIPFESAHAPYRPVPCQYTV